MNHPTQTLEARPVTHPDWLWMGLMSGTSTDGVDGVIARFLPDGQCQVEASAAIRFSPELRSRLLALQTPGAHPEGLDLLLETELAINELTDLYSECARRLLGRSACPSSIGAARVRAAGAHGQTLRHRPDLGVTLQSFNPARFHVNTGLTVVSDFRRADVASGGQGAPLVPAFHRWWLEGLESGSPVEGLSGRVSVVLNIGGFANLSCIGPAGVSGFDAGPGNVLLDAWANRHLGVPYDADGAWGATGTVQPDLLARLLAHPFFSRPFPRSTGRDDFHLEWLLSVLANAPAQKPADVQATLMALTVQGILQGIPAGCDRVLVCGGGAFNSGLMRTLSEALPGVRVESTAVHGVPPDQMEALAFAWLARQRLCGLPGNVRNVTGARQEVLLGALTGL